MPKKPPPIWPKGTRPPNSGRKKGVPNKVSVEARTLASQLVNDVIYQAKLRDDFRRRRVHPTIEALIWTYHLGKPTQPIAMSGSMAFDVKARLDEERRVFASLDIHDLEQLARESQSLVDRAFALARANASPMLIGVSPSPAGDVHDYTAAKPTSPLEPSTSAQTLRVADHGVEPAEGGDSSDEADGNLGNIDGH